MKAIKHVETNQKYIYDNIHANAYNQLAKLSYYQNNFEQALIYTNQGINQFVKNGKQKHLWYSLNMNKAVYLERLGYNGEAKEILKLLLKHQSEIDNVTDPLVISRGLHQSSSMLPSSKFSPYYN